MAGVHVCGWAGPRWNGANYTQASVTDGPIKHRTQHPCIYVCGNVYVYDAYAVVVVVLLYSHALTQTNQDVDGC